VEVYIFSTGSNGTDVRLKFCIMLLTSIDIQFILIPTWSPTCRFLLKTANINIYVAEEHYLGNWLTCCTTDSIIHFLFYTSRGTRHCPGWPMAKLDSNFKYYVTKKGGRNKLWKCVRVKYVPCYVWKGLVITQKHARAWKRQHGVWIQCLVLQLMRKQKTCKEIVMLPSVWNVTEVFYFPLGAGM
jgi:hypothetical protein